MVLRGTAAVVLGPDVLGGNVVLGPVSGGTAGPRTTRPRGHPVL